MLNADNWLYAFLDENGNQFTTPDNIDLYLFPECRICLNCLYEPYDDQTPPDTVELAYWGEFQTVREFEQKFLIFNPADLSRLTPGLLADLYQLGQIEISTHYYPGEGRLEDGINLSFRRGGAI